MSNIKGKQVLTNVYHGKNNVINCHPVQWCSVFTTIKTNTIWFIMCPLVFLHNTALSRHNLKDVLCLAGCVTSIFSSHIPFCVACAGGWVGETWAHKIVICVFEHLMGSGRIFLNIVAIMSSMKSRPSSRYDHKLCKHNIYRKPVVACA